MPLTGGEQCVVLVTAWNVHRYLSISRSLSVLVDAAVLECYVTLEHTHIKSLNCIKCHNVRSGVRR